MNPTALEQKSGSINVYILKMVALKYVEKLEQPQCKKNIPSDPEDGGSWFVWNICKSPVYQTTRRHTRKSVVLMRPMELPADR